ncbi:MAG: hypothetical protein HYS07_08455 [Chlamydiae bacterium]|nr:hypothetical protein [Chlamydiota bacterium]MBI3276404.1 hypothetical protein [Chlamydiota bacterium]
MMLSPFESLFGIPQREVRKNVLLLPILPKGFLNILGFEKLTRGFLYASASIENWTLIQTGMGAPLVGDAVLYLEGSCCQNLLLVGSCGALPRSCLEIGNLVYPEKCLAIESFSEFLLEEISSLRVLLLQNPLLKKWIEVSNSVKIRPVTCATLPSLKLEEEREEWLFFQGVDVVDMECSAFFSAAQYCKIPASALFYVTDIVNEKPFYNGGGFKMPSHLFEVLKKIF